MKQLRAWDDVTLVQVSREDQEFYRYLGPFFGSRQAAKELGMPIWDDEGRLWVVALVGGQPVGCASLEVRGRKGALKSAWVRPEHRHRDIYTAMLEERLRMAVDLGLAVLMATCTEASRAVLERYGFQEVARRGRYYVMRREMANGAAD